MTSLIDIEGIGDAFAEKFKAINIRTVEDLLSTGCNPAGRKMLAEKTGISDKLILRWVNCADLYRIKGIGQEYSQLLEAAGVDTVVELAQRNAANLTAKMAEVQAAKKLVRRVPVQSQVEEWIAQAKTLPRVVTY